MGVCRVKSLNSNHLLPGNFCKDGDEDREPAAPTTRLTQEDPQTTGLPPRLGMQDSQGSDQPSPDRLTQARELQGVQEWVHLIRGGKQKSIATSMTCDEDNIISHFNKLVNLDKMFDCLKIYVTKVAQKYKLHKLINNELRIKVTRTHCVRSKY